MMNEKHLTRTLSDGRLGGGCSTTVQGKNGQSVVWSLPRMGLIQLESRPQLKDAPFLTAWGKLQHYHAVGGQ